MKQHEAHRLSLNTSALSSAALQTCGGTLICPVSPEDLQDIMLALCTLNLSWTT